MKYTVTLTGADGEFDMDYYGPSADAVKARASTDWRSDGFQVAKVDQK